MHLPPVALLCPRPAGALPGESRPAIAGIFQTVWVLLLRALYKAAAARVGSSRSSECGTAMANTAHLAPWQDFTIYGERVGRSYHSLHLWLMKRGCSPGALRELQGSGVSRPATWSRSGGALGKFTGPLWAEDSGDIECRSGKKTSVSRQILRLLTRLKLKKFFFFPKTIYVTLAGTELPM